MNTTIITSKGTTTIPKIIRDKLGLKAGSHVNFVVKDNKIHLEKALSLDEVRALNQKYIDVEKLKLTTEQAIENARQIKTKELKKKH